MKETTLRYPRLPFHPADPCTSTKQFQQQIEEVCHLPDGILERFPLETLLQIRSRAESTYELFHTALTRVRVDSPAIGYETRVLAPLQTARHQWALLDAYVRDQSARLHESGLDALSPRIIPYVLPTGLQLKNRPHDLDLPDDVDDGENDWDFPSSTTYAP